MNQDKDRFAERLAEIESEFQELRTSYRHYTKNGELNNDTLNYYQGKFIDLKADLRKYKAFFTNSWTRFDDKSATAIKFRIACAISEGRYEDAEDVITYEKCSMNTAEKYASASRKYREFVDKRAFLKESLTNISDLREDCSSYINEIKNLL